MKVIALFNNKGGVGKTTLAYHLAWMLPRLGCPTLAIDMDPQANLTAAFLDPDTLEKLWESRTDTILSAVDPSIQGTGDIKEAYPRQITEGLWLLPGDLGLSQFEDKLSESWGKVAGKDPAALRVTSAFHRVIQAAGRKTQTEVALVDVGPNLGAINRAALLATDNVVIPVAADLFSLKGLENLGPRLRHWREDWEVVLKLNRTPPVELPKGIMRPSGYIVMQHAVRQDRPVRAYGRWLARIPQVYRESVLDEPGEQMVPDPNLIGTIRNYLSLMPLAQDARKPIFDLRPADGAIGGHYYAVQSAGEDFAKLSTSLLRACSVDIPTLAGNP